MKSILRNTAILSSSSILTMMVSLITSKFLAVMIGPSGFGFVGLLQSLIILCGLIAGMGIGVGFVRLGSSAIANQKFNEVANLRRAAWLITFILWGVASILLFIFRNKVSYWILGGAEHSGTLVFISVALLFSMSATLQSSILNAYHRVRALAKISVIDSLVGGCFSISIIWIFGLSGIAPMVIIATVISWIVSRIFLVRNVKPDISNPSKKDVSGAAKSLLYFGGPYTASLLIGTGVQQILPVLILHILGTESVGHFRAAIGISGRYLSFLIAAIAQDYYPRVSAVVDKPTVLVQLINEQHRLVMLVSVPIVLVTLALVPYLVPILYSDEFYPAIKILEWQLIGDLFKLSSWTMSYVIMVRCGSPTFFLTELIAGVTTFVTSWMGIRLFGLAGLGMSYLFTYIIYYLVVWIIVHRDIDFVWAPSNKWMLFSAMACAIIVLMLPWTIFNEYRTGVALLFASIIGARNLRIIWGEMRA